MRIVSSNLALFAGPVSGSGLSEIHGVQSLNLNTPISLLETPVYGQIEKSLEYPGFTESTLSFSYYCDGFDNEGAIGLFTGNSTGAAYNFSQNQERNLYIFVSPKGTQAKSLGPADGKVIALGNGFLSSYSVSAAIGSFPTASVSFEFLNASAHASGVSLRNPAIYSGSQYTGVLTTPTVVGSVGRPGIVRPGEIQVQIQDGIFQSADNLIQSFKIDFNIGKENVPVAGSRYPRRIAEMPVNVDLSVDILSSSDNVITGNVYEYLCGTGLDDITVTFRGRCDPMDFVSRYSLKGMKFNGESFSSDIGKSQITTLSWRGQMGISGTGDGVFLASVQHFYISPSGEYYLSPEGEYYTWFE